MKRMLYMAVLVLICIFSASCNKEKTCACTYEYKYTDDPNTYTIKREIKVDRGSCEDIDGLYDDNIPNGNAKYHVVNCKDIED